MLKHLLSVAAVAAIAAGSAFAQSVKIGETSYATIKDAVAAAVDNDVITIEGTNIVDSRIDTDGKHYTIKGVGADAVVKRADNYDKAIFLYKNGGTVTWENVSFDGSDVMVSVNKQFEITTNANVSFTDCKFANFKNQRVIFCNATLNLTNVTFSNCELGEGNCCVFVGAKNKVTLAGQADYTVRIEKDFNVLAGENLSGNIGLYLDNYTDGRLVVSGSTDTGVFTLPDAPEGYSLVEKDGNLVLNYTKNVVWNETTDTYYTSLSAAIDASVENQVLVVLENLDVADRIDNKDYVNNRNRNLTIKGADPDNKIVLKRTFKDKLFVTTNGWFTFENIVFDCNNMANNKFELEDNQGALVLNNVDIINSVSSQGLITVKGGRTLKLNGVTKSNCTSATPDIVLNGKMEISGNNNLSVNVNNLDITVNGELTNEEPVMLTIPAETELGTVIVKGTTERSKFSLTNEGRYLKSDKDANALVLSDKVQTGIEDVEAEENAPAEYFTVSGVRVAAEGLAPGIYVKRAGSKVEKVYVK